MTHAVLFEFFFLVSARTDYLSILLGVSRYDATRAVTLSELLLSDSETLRNLIDSLFVRIELNSLFLCIPFGPVLYLFGLFVDVHEVTARYYCSEKAKLLVRYVILLFLFGESAALFRIS
jgi:hypothetical protein